jgi:hypothetical protein
MVIDYCRSCISKDRTRFPLGNCFPRVSSNITTSDEFGPLDGRESFEARVEASKCMDSGCLGDVYGATALETEINKGH